MAEAAQFGKPQFELTGGTLCLDFANTSEDHKAPETAGEKIQTYADLLAFEVQTGDLPVADARKLLAAANDSSPKAQAVLRKGRELREVIYRVFVAASEEQKPSREDLETLNTFLAETLRHVRVSQQNGGFTRTWDDPSSLERPLWPIVASAADLLTGTELDAVRQCHSDRCSWLFLDRSHNRSRRWCDMKTCGNRAKAKRHYERVKA